MSAWLDGFAGGPFDGRELLVCIGALIAFAAYASGLKGGRR